jgi:sugar-specific transcriptional regulator TrmB
MEIPELSQNESKVYLALLNMKEGGATKISQKCGLFRTLVYDILTKLTEKGLVSYSKKQGKRTYLPNSPERLLENIKEREREMERVLPKLRTIFSKPEEELSVEQYEGVSGVKSAIEDMVSDVAEGKAKEVFFLGPRGTSFDNYGAYLQDAIKKARFKLLFRKIDFRIIWSGDIKINKTKTLIGKPKDHRFLPKELASTVPFIVYGDKFAINGGENKLFVVIIKNKETAKSFKHYFEFIWKKCKS